MYSYVHETVNISCTCTFHVCFIDTFCTNIRWNLYEKHSVYEIVKISYISDMNNLWKVCEKYTFHEQKSCSKMWDYNYDGTLLIHWPWLVCTFKMCWDCNPCIMLKYSHITTALDNLSFIMPWIIISQRVLMFLL